MRIPDSSLAGEIARHIENNYPSCFILSLDAPMEGGPVSVESNVILWEGVDLLRAGVIWLECPVFPWPQPRLSAKECDSIDEYKQGAAVWREAQSLAVSAIAAAAESIPVVNAPKTTHLAVSPIMALDLLAREGFEVHPWRVETVSGVLDSGTPDFSSGDSGFGNSDIGNSGDGGKEQTRIDVAGRDRRHVPGRPETGDPALYHDPVSSDAATFLIVGEKCVGGLAHPGQPVWSESDSVVESLPESAHLAVRATRTLGLDFAAVSVCFDDASSAILFCDAAPDLEAWNRMLEGGVAAALAEYLTESVQRKIGSAKGNKELAQETEGSAKENKGEAP